MCEPHSGIGAGKWNEKAAVCHLTDRHVEDSRKRRYDHYRCAVGTLADDSAVGAAHGRQAVATFYVAKQTRDTGSVRPRIKTGVHQKGLKPRVRTPETVRNKFGT